MDKLQPPIRNRKSSFSLRIMDRRTKHGWVVAGPFRLTIFAVILLASNPSLMSQQVNSHVVLSGQLAVSGKTSLAGPLTLQEASSEVSLVYTTTKNNSTTSKLVELLREAKLNLSPTHLPAITPAKQQLQEAIKRLEQFVVVDSENGKRWSEFLRLAEIRDQLNSQSPNYVRLLDLETNMRQNYPGLEYPQFVNLRQALRQYAYAARGSGREDRFIKFLAQSLDKAIEQANQSEAIDSAVASQLVTVSTWLHQSNQSTKQLRELQQLFSKPNLALEIDESILQRLAARPVAQPQNVNECILGTRILGQAYMNGDVGLSLMPVQQGVGVKIDLKACLSSQSRGFNRGVVLNSVSSSPVLASKQIIISENGVSASQAAIQTALQNEILSIEHRSRIVRRIAKKKAAQQKPQADAIAEGRLQKRVSDQFNQQVDQQVAQASPRLAELRTKPIKELSRLGIEKPRVDVNSTTRQILANSKQANEFQLAAYENCAIAVPQATTFLARIHESAVNNTLAPVLAGRTIRNHELGDYFKQYIDKIPEDLQKEIEGEPWSITLNLTEPVRINFEQSTVLVTIRLAQLTRGKEVLNDPHSITARYRPTISNGSLSLTREGDVEVISDEAATGTRATGLRSFMRNKFDKTFKHLVQTDPINFTQLRSRFPQVSRLNLDINRWTLNMERGWLQLAAPL